MLFIKLLIHVGRHSSITGLENNKFFLPDKKINLREPKLKSQRVLNINPEPGDRLAFGVVTAASAKDNTAVARIGFDNDALMSEGNDCGTWIGGVGAFPATDRDGRSRCKIGTLSHFPFTRAG